jgi:putative copper export protein
MLGAIAYTLHVILAGVWLGGVVFTTVLLPNYKHRGTQGSCPTVRERRRPVRIGEVFAVGLD